MKYQIAFAMDNGEWDIVDTFDADNDEDANEYAEEHYPRAEWYVLRDGSNING